MLALARQRRAHTAFLLSCCLNATCQRRPQTAGLVVEHVEPGTSAARAELKPGDVLLRWERAPRSAGSLRSPHELRSVEVEQAPMGPVTLEGRRGKSASSWRLATGRWRLQVRPVFEGSLLEHYEVGRRHLNQGRPAEAAAAWQPLVTELKRARRGDDACWLRVRIGQVFASAKRWTDAQAALAGAREDAQALGRPELEGDAWDAAGDAYRAQGELDRAEDAYRTQLHIRDQASPDGPMGAVAMGKLASLSYRERDDKRAAEEWFRQVVTRRQRQAPKSLETAAALSDLGAALSGQGELERAESHYRQALALIEQLLPDSQELANALAGLGSVLRRRGDLAAAEALYQRALGINERVGGQVWLNLNSLGILAYDRGNYDEADSYYRRALAVLEGIDPQGLDVARALSNLGETAFARKDWDRAESFYRRALALKVAPGTLTMAASFHSLGDVALARGTLDAAEHHYNSALALRLKLAPGTLEVAETLAALGAVLEKRRQWSAAFGRHEEAWRIRSRLAPRSGTEAHSLHALGRVRRAQGHAPEALRYLRTAADALEAQRGRLGTGLSASALTAKYAQVYHDLIALLVEQKQAAQAFAVLERARARGLLAMLAERELAFADAPAELERERRQAEAAYDTTLPRLGALGARSAPEEVETLRRRLDEDASRRAQVAWKIRAASPRLAALRNPEPLDFASARSALDPGTVLLAYNVAEQRTHLFAVRSGADRRDSGGLAVFTLPLGEEALRQRVLAFRGLIEGAREPQFDKPLAVQAGRLFDDLVRPAARMLAESQRALIVPDGPLHALPFGALLESRRPRRYFAESLPLHTAFSVSVYAELKSTHRREPESGSGVLVAFGDPDRPATDVAGGIEAGGAARRLKAIPDSREEVLRIVNLFGPGAVAHVGADATEERARALGRGVRYVHFACHGLIDLRRPLDSALVLSLSSRQKGTHNGLLQAWEIFERLRLDADLVTLSACDTALGRELAGEGLIGLTRAFQYAGARSVLSSLWSVADQSTAELMESFYRELRSGKPKDEALQVAQVAMIRRGVPSFHWAPFQITGDWQ